MTMVAASVNGKFKTSANNLLPQFFSAIFGSLLTCEYGLELLTRGFKIPAKMTDFEKKVEEFVGDLYKIKGIKFGQYKLKSGITSPVYFDLRVIVSYPKLMVTLSELLSELMQNKNVEADTICGVPYTALPIATLVSTSTNVPMVVRRKEQKAYGTGRMVEGEFTPGATCVIIEDVISTGSSILETARDLESAGLKVKDAVIVLDREHGAFTNLEVAGLRPHVLITLTQLLAVLFCRGHITQRIVADVKKFVAESQVKVDGTIKTEGIIPNPRLTSPFLKRSELTQNLLSKRLFCLMEEKQTLLCVAADVATVEELLKVVDQVGPHVAVLKTHVDAIRDFTPTTAKDLVFLANKHKFLILEDRKFADIGHTVEMQYTITQEWAQLVTAHSLPGWGVISGLKSAATSSPVGVFLVAELSSKGALTNTEYAKATIKMAEESLDTVVGVVAQSSDLLTNPGMIQLTPGVHLQAAADGLGQQYVHPRQAVLDRGADLVVVGRAIFTAEDVAGEAERYKKVLWEAYRERVQSS